MAYFRSNIEMLDGYVPGEQPTEQGVVKLNTNENPYPPSPKVLQAIAAVTGEQLRRYPPPLGDAFRQAAAEILGLRPEMIVCGNGMDELLNMTVRAFSGPEATLVYPTPTYTLYAVLAAIQASMVAEVPFGPRYELPFDGLVEAAGRVTYLCNPNSPSGTFFPPDRVAELARKVRGVLVVDEAYVDFADTNCMSLVKDLPNVLVLRTLSKGYSLAGLRFGYGVAQPHLIEGLMKVKDSYNVDAISIPAAAAAIRDQACARQNWQRVRQERQRLTVELTTMGFDVLPSQSNFVLATIAKPPAEHLYQSLKARKILIRYFNQPRLKDSLRITVGTPEQNDTLLAALHELIG
jgi:histidinol-phosphate aminotransferase